MYLKLHPPETVPKFPESLEHILDACLKEHQALHSAHSENARLTRDGHKKLISEHDLIPWRTHWTELLLHSPQKVIVYNINFIGLADDSAWLVEAVHIEASEEITHEDAMNLFLSVFILVNYGYVQLALDELIGWQRFLALKFSDQQRNLVLDVINQVDDELYDPVSPDTDTEDMKMDQLLAPKVANRKLPAKKVIKSLEFYVNRCLAWQQILQDHLLNLPTDESVTFVPMQRKVALTIQEMKKVPASIYTQSKFIAAVKSSGIGTTITELSNPAYGYKHGNDPHHAQLLRLHGFGLVLGSLLDDWTPKPWKDLAKESLMQDPPQKYHTQNLKAMKTGKNLFQALKKYPYLIPNVSNPASVFFLCSEENFTSAWNQWLSWVLDAAGYRVYDTIIHNLYSNTLDYLSTMASNNSLWQDIKRHWDPTIVLIVEQTLNLRQLLHNIDSHAHGPEVKHCAQCTGQKESKKCIQHIKVRLNNDPAFVARWNKVGVTLVPEHERMRPRPARKASSSTSRIVHPNDIDVKQSDGTWTKGLRHIAADEEIIQRCGKQIYLFFEGHELNESLVQCDFVWYEAFSRGNDGEFARLLRYSKTATGVQPVHRGGYYRLATLSVFQIELNLNLILSTITGVSGTLLIVASTSDDLSGAGVPTIIHAGIEVETYEGINILFEQAQMSAIILRTARAIHPDLVAKIRSSSAACERVGISGLNLFNCNGYTAPQHLDEDCTPSLSAQFILQAEQKWSEFGFCALQYGYYIKTRENTLWSFNSGLLHGTMLPSEQTILRLRGGANGTASIGSHTTTRKRDQRRAENNEQTRQNYNLRDRAWRDN
ncbi:hypothetical protein F5050DRAFT_1715896 [Lentinula boryana]|uniref:Uncharacterized protein n=1 Tax=Lentinula boryana TaxID=40481 RepID=A0ABQ8PZ10_9AGAR|nr:hypothetical protein F5050DRAFT_1715896 [Lentinula boryana]